jgi:hypothetical protein
MDVIREAIERVPGFLFRVRSVAGLAGVKERIMGSTERKRAREQNAAARRERAVKKRTEKSAVPSGASGTVRVEMPEQIPEAALPAERDA